MHEERLYLGFGAKGIYQKGVKDEEGIERSQDGSRHDTAEGS